MEWGSQSSVTTLESYSSFVGPLRRAEQVVHVRTEPNQAYALELDLYLIGFSESVPNERTGMFTVLVDGAPVIEQTFGSFRDLNGDDDEKNSDESINSPRNGHIIRGVQTRFTASSDVAEIVIKGNTGPGFGTGSWGFDNVLIDEAPETNLGSFSTADFTGDAEFTAFNQTPQRLNTQALQRNPGVDRLPDPRPFKATRGRSNPFFDLQAFLEELLEDLEDEEMMDEEEMMEDMMDDEEDEGEDQEDMPDENVPAPGPASLLMLGAAAGLRRRR
jgi:MYXO-CTERM domain-containing protein